MHRIFIDGSAGTTGLCIAERLANRKEITLVTLPEEKRKHLEARIQAAQSADLALLCLPDDAARELVAQLPPHVKICDTSTAHRTASGWEYGFPELSGRRERIQNATRTSVPGCHASGFISMAAPLVERGFLPADAQLAAWSLTGYTGGGKSMIAAYEVDGRAKALDAPRSYGLALKHKHLPEMQAVSGLTAPPLFSPIVADFPRGMAVYLPLFSAQLAQQATGEHLAQALAEYYAGEQGIVVHPFGALPQDGFLPANLCADTDRMELFCFGNGAQILLASVFDNLGKGSSGAAVQCMNLMLGLPEREGLA